MLASSSTPQNQTLFATRRAGDTAKRIQILAADLIDLQAENDARRSRLLELGWPAAFLDQYEQEARAQANLQFVQDVNADRIRPDQQVKDDMVDVILGLFPTTQFIVAQLQARGVSVNMIDLYLRKAKARAAMSFIHQGVH